MSREYVSDVQRQGWKNGEQTDKGREREACRKNMMEAGIWKFSKGGEAVEGREGRVTNVSVSGTVWQ